MNKYLLYLAVFTVVCAILAHDCEYLLFFLYYSKTLYILKKTLYF